MALSRTSKVVLIVGGVLLVGLIVGFIAASLAVTLGLSALGGRATPLLIAAGTINGVLLPVILGVILIAAYRRSLMGGYRHPWWAAALGGLAWVATLFLACQTLLGLVGG